MGQRIVEKLGAPEWVETDLRRARAQQAALKRWAASPHLGPVVREAVEALLEAQKKTTRRKLKEAVLWRSDRRRREIYSIFPGFIDPPSPFAPVDELRRFIKAMEKLAPFYEDVRMEIKHAKDAIEWRLAYEKRRSDRKA